MPMKSGVQDVRVRRRRGAIAFAGAALILLTIVGLSYQELLRYGRADADAALTAEILGSVDRLQLQVLDAETGQRGFLLTGEDRYLEPYNAAARTIPGELAQVDALLSRRRSETGNLTEIHRLILLKMQELAHTIELRRSGGAAAALGVVLGDQGRRTMVQIRQVVSAIHANEGASARNASAEGEAATRTALLVTIGGALILLFLFAAGLDPILDAHPRAPGRSRLKIYGSAVLATILADLLGLASTALRGPTPESYIFFYPAVLFASWYGGFRAGALAIVLSATAAFSSAVSHGSTDYITLLLFILVCTGIAVLGHTQRRALQRADQEAAQRRAAEDAERALRERFETTLASIGDAVVSTDARGNVLFANEMACALLRCPLTAVAGKPFASVFRMVNEETREPVESPVDKVLREGDACGLANHTILIAADGAEVPIDDSGAPVRGADGAITGVVLVFRDITERRAGEKRLLEQAAELQETAERFQTLASAIPQLVWIAHADGWIFWFNERWYEYTGTTPAEMEGWGWQSVHDPAVLSSVLERWKASVATGMPFDMTFPLRGADGVFRPFLTRVMPVRDAAGKVVRWFGTNTDISEMCRVEEALRTSEARLARSIQELARSNEDLERFAFVASHDLQEPLRMISTYAQLLTRQIPGDPDSTVTILTRHLLDGVTRMRELLSDLLAYAEIGARRDPRMEAVDLNAVVNDVKENLHAAIEESGAVIECAGLPTVRADAAHFIPLFQNLIGNAIKYRGECPPWIRISTEERDGDLCFAVSDNGIGIDPQYQQKIFDVFERLHGREIPGTGMGLAICQRVVERYGGRVWVESEIGRGSTFYFTLPGIAIQSAGS